MRHVNILLRLWWLHKRRTFNKRDLIVTAYLFSVYVVTIVGFCIAAAAMGIPVEKLYLPSAVGVALVIVMLIPDIIMKMTMKGDATYMDDYLKSRPIPEKSWARFLLVSNVISFWNYIIPVMLIPLFFWLLSIGEAVACLLMMIIFSYADSLFVACFRRTSDRFLHFSLISGWFIMFFSATELAVVTSFMSATAQCASMLLLALAVNAGLAAFLANEDNYDETKHKAARQHSLGRVTLFNMQFYGILRARRLRNMILLMSIIFIGEAYLTVWMGNTDESLTVYTIFSVLMPSLVLSQWTFGVEANFFQGLMTKPVTVERLLTNCFYFYIILSAAGTVLLVPMLFVTDAVTPLMLAASLSLAVFINLFNMPTCLFSTRLELFSKTFFNVQGANMKVNFYALALLLPGAVFVGLWLLCGPTVWSVVSIVIGIASLAVHKPVIRRVANAFYKRRYERMESFMN